MKLSKSYRLQIEAVNAKITKLQEQLKDLQAKAALGIDLADVQAGRTVTFKYGKSPNLRELTGLVLGRKDPEAGAKGGSIVRVRVGTGFEEEIVSIYPQQVTAMVPVAKPEEAEEMSSEKLAELLND